MVIMMIVVVQMTIYHYEMGVRCGVKEDCMPKNGVTPCLVNDSADPWMDIWGGFSGETEAELLCLMHFKVGSKIYELSKYLQSRRFTYSSR